MRTLPDPTNTRLLRRRPPFWRNLGRALCLLTLTLGPAGAATTNRVQMTGSDSFSPRLLTNHVGDTVIWTNTTLTAHDVVSSNAAWTSSALFTAPGQFTNTFASAGVYGYYCSVHLAFGMTGIIYVQSNPVPAVTLTNPPNGSTLAAPATVTLGAEASEAGGTITNVQFYSGANLLGASTTSPYALVVNSLTAGPYSFTARAFDSHGVGATSAVVSVSVVTPAAFRFADTSLTPVNGQFPLILQSLTPGLRYEIDGAPAFSNWLRVTNFMATSATMNFATPATGAYRFFKAILLPNP